MTDFSYWFDWAYTNLPAGWFPVDPTEAPVVSAVVSGLATGLAQAACDNTFTANQAYIQTATGEFLDIASVDFFGFGNLPRRTSETDDAYRARILAELLRPRGTRAAMISAINDLTGYDPVIFEPIRDASAFDGNFYWDYNFYYGSYEMPFQFFMNVRRPSGVGNAYNVGWDTGYWDYNMVYGDIQDFSSVIEDDEIYRVIRLTIPAGVKAWVQIQNGPLTTLSV